MLAAIISQNIYVILLLVLKRPSQKWAERLCGFQARPAADQHRVHLQCPKPPDMPVDVKRSPGDEAQRGTVCPRGLRQLHLIMFYLFHSLSGEMILAGPSSPLKEMLF